MTPEQFNQLRDELCSYSYEICTKLEQIRCGIIDVENELIKINENKTLTVYGNIGFGEED
ncbi:hypothetical protein KA005_67865 [bacterium]|nr:hypothetical protein [bacterium]